MILTINIAVSGVTDVSLSDRLYNVSVNSTVLGNTLALIFPTRLLKLDYVCDCKNCRWPSKIVFAVVKIQCIESVNFVI